jgi:hypothetical protein
MNLTQQQQQQQEKKKMRGKRKTKIFKNQF